MLTATDRRRLGDAAETLETVEVALRQAAGQREPVPGAGRLADLVGAALANMAAVACEAPWPSGEELDGCTDEELAWWLRETQAEADAHKAAQTEAQQANAGAYHRLTVRLSRAEPKGRAHAIGGRVFWLDERGELRSMPLAGVGS
jgi:hypothetical protein